MSLVQWKADEEELAAARAGYHKARSRWRVAKVRRGDAMEMFFVAKIARSSDCCVVGCVWFSLLRYPYLGFVVF